MKDRTGTEKHVVLLKSKPQDFERSQQVVIVGSMKGDDFIANDILMKCPSKYNNGQVNQ
jgi:cytochrome c-type biogenesis protein CcmE